MINNVMEKMTSRNNISNFPPAITVKKPLHAMKQWKCTDENQKEKNDETLNNKIALTMTYHLF